MKLMAALDRIDTLHTTLVWEPQNINARKEFDSLMKRVKQHFPIIHADLQRDHDEH